jgi:hypothetical protein
MARARNRQELLLQQTRDKSIELRGDVILDDTNIATIATQTTTSATKNTAIATSVATTATKTTGLDNQSFGKNGCTIFPYGMDALEDQDGTYYAMQMINDTTFDALTGVECEGTFTGQVFPAGSIIYMDISSINISVGGPIILYKV